MKCKLHGIKGTSKLECKSCPFLEACIEESDAEEYEFEKQAKGKKE